jgi:hypothetical protein
MLEIRIHCRFLSKTFEDLENFITSITYVPLNNNQKSIEIRNKRYKIIQEGKRIWLNYILNAYEIKIKEYEAQYQSEWNKLESHLLHNTMTTDLPLWNHIKEYINHRINRLKQEIIDKMSPFRRILLQNRQRSLSRQNTVGVSPEPYLDLLTNPFNTHQWTFLLLGNFLFFSVKNILQSFFIYFFLLNLF